MVSCNFVHTDRLGQLQTKEITQLHQVLENKYSMLSHLGIETYDISFSDFIPAIKIQRNYLHYYLDTLDTSANLLLVNLPVKYFAKRFSREVYKMPNTVEAVDVAGICNIFLSIRKPSSIIRNILWC